MPRKIPPDQEPVLTTASRHCTVSGLVGYDHKTMMPKPIVVDTGSGYNFIRQDALPPGWER